MAFCALYSCVPPATWPIQRTRATLAFPWAESLPLQQRQVKRFPSGLSKNLWPCRHRHLAARGASGERRNGESPQPLNALPTRTNLTEQVSIPDTILSATTAPRAAHICKANPLGAIRPTLTLLQQISDSTTFVFLFRPTHLSHAKRPLHRKWSVRRKHSSPTD